MVFVYLYLCTVLVFNCMSIYYVHSECLKHYEIFLYTGTNFEFS